MGKDKKGQAEQEGHQDLHLTEMDYWREGGKMRRRGECQEDGCYLNDNGTSSRIRSKALLCVLCE
jgi:hypothetical protein